MIISKNGEIIDSGLIEHNIHDKTIKINENHCVIDLSSDIYNGYSVEIGKYCIIKCALNMSVTGEWNCTFYCENNCNIEGTLDCTVYTKRNCTVSVLCRSHIFIDSHQCNIRAVSNCMIRDNTWAGCHTFDLGSNNVLYFRSYDSIWKSDYIRVRSDKEAIGTIICEDGTKLLMDDNFLRKLKIFKG
jgi:hypothetical protein